jgi:hypothetical protein
LEKIIAKIADLGSKKAGLSSDFWENCIILKKISIEKCSIIIHGELELTLCIMLVCACSVFLVNI